MSFNFDTFSSQKKDNDPLEYEDAWSIKQVSDNEYRVSVADGATESSFARIWAKLLTDGYSEGSKIEELQSKWTAEIDAMELPWYSKEKAEQGAFAAFLGVTITGGADSDCNRFEIITVGDCCFFQIRNNEILLAYPLKQASDFDNSPALLCSKTLPKEETPEFQTESGNWNNGDIIILMTDAIASWFLKKIEEKEAVIERVLDLSTEEEFLELVNSEREAKNEENVPNLKNDDVTLVKIYLKN